MQVSVVALVVAAAAGSTDSQRIEVVANDENGAWHGPVDSYHSYSDSDCVHIHTHSESNLNGCFSDCNNKDYQCNAVNWNPDTNTCVTRACLGDAKYHPTGHSNFYLAYYYESSSETEPNSTLVPVAADAGSSISEDSYEKVSENVSATWAGPVDSYHTYSDSDCVHIHTHSESNLNACFIVCTNQDYQCNAVNWNSYTNTCVTRGCLGDAKKHPTGHSQGYLAYYLVSETVETDAAFVQV